MAEHMMQNVKILIGSYDMSGKSNSVTLNYTAEMLDRTCFGSSARKRLAGLIDFDFRLSGYWGSTNVDNAHFAAIGSSERVLSVTASSTDGQTAFLSRAVLSEYTPAGTIGDLFAYDVVAVGTPLGSSGPNSLHRGKILSAQGASTRKGSTNSAAVNLGTATTSQRLYATFHLFEDLTTNVSSGGIKGDIVASCSSGFGVGATTQITIARATAITGLAYSTKVASTSKGFYRFEGVTTSTAAGGYLNFCVCAAIR